MFAKSFIALDGNGRLTGARTAQAVPYDRYTYHLCNSVLQYRPEYATERTWFKHTDNGQYHCLMSVLKRMRHTSLNVCNAFSPMPLPGSLKPAGTAHNVLPITMVNVTA